MNKITGFPPILPSEPKVLILGSMPSVESLRRRQYYAHPKNAFWRIMGALLGFDPDLSYPRRVAALRRANLALWDVLKCCERDGSLDAAIVPSSEEPNAIAEMLARRTSINAVLLNGKKASASFRRHLQAAQRSETGLKTGSETGLEAGPEIIELPSTSPANARLTFEQKLAAWRVVCDYL